MAVTITLSTALVGSRFFDGLTAERFDKVQINLSGASVSNYVRRDSFRLSQSSNVAELVFNDVANGKHRFRLRDQSSGKIFWRSAELETTNGNERFSFTVLQIPVEELTFRDEDLEGQVELPINEDIAGLDEDVNISELDIAIKSDHIDVDGKGNIAKGDEWTILKSDLNFDYDFRLKAANNLDTKKLLRVSSLHSLSLNLSNPVTGIGAACMENEIKNRIRESFEKELNKKIDARLSRDLGDRFGNSPLVDQITATVIRVDIREDGTTLVEAPLGGSVSVTAHRLELTMHISMPSALLTTGSAGCLRTTRTLALLSLILSGLWLLF